MASDQIQISSGEENRFVDKRRSNVKTDLIEITEDKLENILLKHAQNVGLRKRWVLPLGFLVSVVLTLTTATFKDAFGLNAPVWHALFIILAIVSSVWLLADVVRLAQCWSKTTISYLIRLIKNAQGDG